MNVIIWSYVILMRNNIYHTMYNKLLQSFLSHKPNISKLDKIFVKLFSKKNSLPNEFIFKGVTLTKTKTRYSIDIINEKGVQYD